MGRAAETVSIPIHIGEETPENLVTITAVLGRRPLKGHKTPPYYLCVYGALRHIRWIFSGKRRAFEGETTAIGAADKVRHTFRPTTIPITTKPLIIAAAQAFAAELRQEITDRRHAGDASPTKAPETMAEITRWYLAGVGAQLAKQRRHLIGQHMDCWMHELGRDKRPDDLTHQELVTAFHAIRDRPFYASAKKGSRKVQSRSPRTCNGMLVTLRQILGEAKRNGLVDTSPWERLEPLHVPFVEANYWTEDEQRIVLTCAAADEQQPDALLFFGLSLFTGMRRGETVSVRWCDVDWNRKPCPVLMLRERPDFRIKRHQWRDIPLCPDAVRLLTKYAPSNRGCRDHIVQPLREVGRADGSDSIRYDPRKLFLRVVGAATKRGVHRITLREMRHSFACTCLLQHQPADVVARMLGHRNSEMVFRHYAALLHHPEAPPLPAVLPSRLPKRT